MPEYTKMDQFRNEDGSTNWPEYLKAQLKNGEVCTKCRTVLYPPTGSERMCSSCADLYSDTGEVSHDDYIRCPSCGGIETVDFESGVYDPGENKAYCPECGYEYTVQTEITFTFTSPPRISSTEAGGEASDN